MVQAIGPRVRVRTALLGTTATIGGAFDSPRIFRVMHEAVPKQQRPKIAVVLSSKPSTEAARAEYFGDIDRWFMQHGFDPVYVPLTIDNYRLYAHDKRLASKIALCDAVYLAGGDQSRHVRCLLDADGRDTPVMKAIRSVLDRGGLVSGSSAGAAAQGGLQYGGGDVYRYLVENRIPEMGSPQTGLNLLGDDFLVCTHFDQRFRLPRLLVALHAASRPLKGIGVDEDTALFAKGSQARVVGTHGVFFVDPSEAEYGSGPHFEVRGVRLNYLTNGDRIDLESGVHRTSKKRAPSLRGETVYSDDILSKLAMTELLEKMVRTGADRAVGRTREKSPQFEIEVLRDPKTRTYDDGKQIAAVALIVNVRRCA